MFVGNLVQANFLAVDEKGVEAASATHTRLLATSRYTSDPIDMIFDRPFVFLIYQRMTGLIVFMGQVFDPTKTSAG
ncbi:MAG TPA: hypothetical protein EYQ14_24630 [Gammaproteobacteria bacterium]|nr:hypothetical protein [Gammaproteobacteria bacterium]HIL97685.1 hypothetical protein [Pseudomonadales bacterium]